MFKFKQFLFALVLSVNISISFAQKAVKIHSHNDYAQPKPLWNAFSARAASIEIDIILQNDTLFVAHERESIKKKHTIESLYLKPLQTLLEVYPKERFQFQLLIDLKTEAYSTLKRLVTVLDTYPKLWSKGIRIVISGNRPKIEDYNKYPDYISFDYQSLYTVEEKHLDKIALVSLSFKKFSKWNGKEQLTHQEEVAIKLVISKMKQFQKPIRFWATPDNEMAWSLLHELGVDYINTDKPQEVATFFNN